VAVASVYDVSAETIAGEQQPLSAYRGKTLLIVNVASRCGFTPQYAGLEALYRKYRDRGLVVLGFPCNQFGGQEPGSEEDIQQFCRTTYDVTFPLFAKIDVNGPRTHPLYEVLKAARPGVLGTEGIKWNFTKFLVNPQGEVIARYAPSDSPERIERDLEGLLVPPPPS
jgi:glutathione peroxidase